MKKVLVTGSKGFVGRNLVVALQRESHVNVIGFDIDDDPSTLKQRLEGAEVVYHCAGVNRPKSVDEFEAGNVDLTSVLCESLKSSDSDARIVLSSSIQAELDNPYGVSKRRGEEVLEAYARETGQSVCIYRLQNIFGKWCRPNYNSVVATFCHNIAHDAEIQISDENKELQLVYVDDVVRSFLMHLRDDADRGGMRCVSVEPVYTVALGDLAKRIREFRNMRSSAIVPDMDDEFTRKLYATYLSHYGLEELAIPFDVKTDERGDLAELMKSPHVGQIFVFKTRPGAVRGNHYHDSKAERFCAVSGCGTIRLTCVDTGETIDYSVSGKEMKTIEIPPGYIHTVINNSDEDLIIVSWVDEIFNPEEPDTYAADA